MDTRPDSIDADNAIAQLRRSALDGKLVVVVGTGVSMALTNGKNPALSWKGLIESGVNVVRSYPGFPDALGWG